MLGWHCWLSDGIGWKTEGAAVSFRSFAERQGHRPCPPRRVSCGTSSDTSSTGSSPIMRAQASQLGCFPTLSNEFIFSRYSEIESEPFGFGDANPSGTKSRRELGRDAATNCKTNSHRSSTTSHHCHAFNVQPPDGSTLPATFIMLTTSHQSSPGTRPRFHRHQTPAARQAHRRSSLLL